MNYRTADPDTNAVEPYLSLMKKMERERGPFTLFALFEQEDNPGEWDLVVAAPWFGSNTREVVSNLINEIKRNIPKDNRLKLSGVIALKPSDKFVQAIISRFPPEYAMRDISDIHRSQISGLGINSPYIIASNRIVH